MQYCREIVMTRTQFGGVLTLFVTISKSRYLMNTIATPYSWGRVLRDGNKGNSFLRLRGMYFGLTPKSQANWALRSIGLPYFLGLHLLEHTCCFYSMHISGRTAVQRRWFFIRCMPRTISSESSTCPESYGTSRV